MLTGFALNDDFFILKMRSTIDNIIIRNNAIANQINIIGKNKLRISVIKLLRDTSFNKHRDHLLLDVHVSLLINLQHSFQ